MAGAELIGDDVLARSAFYNDFARPYGMFHLLAATAPAGHGNLLTALTTHRARNREPFGQEQRSRMNALLPHVRRSMHIRTILDKEKASLADPVLNALLDAMNAPALICDGNCRVLAANAMAEGTLGLRVFRMGGAPGAVVLRLAEHRSSEQFAPLVAQAAGGKAGGTVQVGSSHVTASPMPPSYARFGVKPGLVLVTAQVLDADLIATRSLAAFQMTPSEAAVAALVATGLSPEQVAFQRGVSLGTVRTLIRRALAKTGADNLRQMAVRLTRL